MSKILAIVTFISMFLVQIHGVTHTNSDNHDKNHNCVICKITSHQESIAPSTSDIELSLNSLISYSLFYLEKYIVLQTNISKKSLPRAPPIA